MPIKGTWREKLNNINDYDCLIEMNKNIRDRYDTLYSVCILDGFIPIEDCRVRCTLYSELTKDGWDYHCDKCIQDFLNEKAR